MPDVQAKVFEVRDHSVGGVERLSLFARVRPELPADSLRAALGWLLHRAVDERNRLEGGNLRVIWAYLYDNDTARMTEWRAMAIWQAPGLQEALRPSGIGGDALRVGTVEYDLTNELKAVPGGDGGQ